MAKASWRGGNRVCRTWQTLLGDVPAPSPNPKARRAAAMESGQTATASEEAAAPILADGRLEGLPLSLSVCEPTCHIQHKVRKEQAMVTRTGRSQVPFPKCQ